MDEELAANKRFDNSASFCSWDPNKPMTRSQYIAVGVGVVGLWIAGCCCFYFYRRCMGYDTQRRRRSSDPLDLTDLDAQLQAEAQEAAARDTEAMELALALSLSTSDCGGVSGSAGDSGVLPVAVPVAATACGSVQPVVVEATPVQMPVSVSS